MQIDQDLTPTKQIVLRELDEQQDAQHIVSIIKLANDHKILNHMLFKADLLRYKNARNFISKIKSENPLEKRVLAITLKESNKLIGLCGLGICLDHIIPTMGYWINSQYRGRGYATEAVGSLIRDILPQFRFAMLRASCEADNITAQRVLLKNGFRAQETTPMMIDPDNKRLDVTWYQLNLTPYQGFNQNNQTKALYM